MLGWQVQARAGLEGPSPILDMVALILYGNLIATL